LPDENVGKSQYIRVLDNEGEDYLYPAALSVCRFSTSRWAGAVTSIVMFSSCRT